MSRAVTHFDVLVATEASRIRAEQVTAERMSERFANVSAAIFHSAETVAINWIRDSAKVGDEKNKMITRVYAATLFSLLAQQPVDAEGLHSLPEITLRKDVKKTNLTFESVTADFGHVQIERNDRSNLNTKLAHEVAPWEILSGVGHAYAKLAETVSSDGSVIEYDRTLIGSSGLWLADSFISKDYKQPDCVENNSPAVIRLYAEHLFESARDSALNPQFFTPTFVEQYSPELYAQLQSPKPPTSIDEYGLRWG